MTPRVRIGNISGLIDSQSGKKVNLLASVEFLIANLVAWPVAYFAMRRWLDNFAYRIELDFGAFILAAALALIIALLTVSTQAIKRRWRIRWRRCDTSEAKKIT